jgi:hypothetical protein
VDDLATFNRRVQAVARAVVRPATCLLEACLRLARLRAGVVHVDVPAESSGLVSGLQPMRPINLAATIVRQALTLLPHLGRQQPRASGRACADDDDPGSLLQSALHQLLATLNAVLLARSCTLCLPPQS